MNLENIGDWVIIFLFGVFPVSVGYLVCRVFKGY